MKQLWKLILATTLTLTVGVTYPLQSFATEIREEEKKPDNDKIAREAVQLIMDVVGLNANFEVLAGKTDNAVAKIKNGTRYIIYDPEFIQEINNNVKTNWAGIAILAHEIGHHLNGHTINKNPHNPQLELESDEFSGFVLRQLGATLHEAQAGMYEIATPRGSKTHPSQKDRLEAIKKGWMKADKIEKEAKKNSRNINKFAFQPMSLDELKQDGYITQEVYFEDIPDRTYYLTKDRYLISYTGERVKRIGKVVKRSGSYYIEIPGKGYFQFTSQGHIYNSSNNRIGYIVNAKS